MAETLFLVKYFVSRIQPQVSCAMGTSGGGYLALLLTAFCGFDRALAFAPQTTFSEKWRQEKKEFRWQEFVVKIHAVVGPEGFPDIKESIAVKANDRSQFHVIYPSGDAGDGLYASHIAGQPGVFVYPVDTAEHNVSGVLKKIGNLEKILSAFIIGDDIQSQLSSVVRSAS